jgi:hypothetical protein
MVMLLEKVSGEPTKEFTSGLPPSLVVTTSLIIVAVVGGLLLLTLNFATIESPYTPQSVNSLINSGAISYAF